MEHLRAFQRPGLFQRAIPSLFIRWGKDEKDPFEGKAFLFGLWYEGRNAPSKSRRGFGPDREGSDEKASGYGDLQGGQQVAIGGVAFCGCP